MFFCGTFSVTSNSRMMYAFARDGGIPGHKFFHKVDAKTQSPIRTGQFLPYNLFVTSLTQRASSVARLHTKLHSRPPQSWQRRCVLCRNEYRNHRLVHLLRFASSNRSFTILVARLTPRLRYPNRPAARLPKAIQARALPSRPVLVSGRTRRLHLDPLHLHRLHLAAGEPGRLADAQLRHRGCRDRDRVRHGLLAAQRAEVVHRSREADPRYVWFSVYVRSDTD